MLDEIRKDFENIYGLESVILYGSVARGDCTKNSDVDLAVFMQDKGFVTPRESYVQLAKLDLDKYDLSLHSVGDVEGFVSSIYSPYFHDHFINNCKVIFDRAEILEKMKGKRKLWSEVEEKTGYDDVNVAGLAYRLLTTRRKCLKIENKLDEYGKEFLRDTIKSFRIGLNGVIRNVLNIEGEYDGSKDDIRTITENFFKLYPECVEREDEYNKLRKLDWFSISNEDLKKEVHKSREIIEFFTGRIDQRIRDKME